MLDIILNIVLIIASALLYIFLNLSDAVLECLIEMIPVVILTIRLWWNKPKRYLYVTGMLNKIVKYTMVIRLEQCDLDKEDYVDLCEKIRNIYGEEIGKIVSENLGEFLWKTYIEVDAGLVELNYNLETGDLYIETKSKIRFRNFIKDVEKISSIVLTFFAESTSSYFKEIVNITISYLKKNKEGIANPFVSKFYGEFNKPVMDFRYQTLNESKIEINNQSICIVGNDIRKVNMDIKKEMLLL